MSGSTKVLLSAILLGAAMTGIGFSAHAQTTGVDAVMVLPGSLQALVHKPLVLRGTLGNEQIQMNLRPKVAEDGLEGSYFVFGQGAQILLAGEVDHDDLLMEESHNGKDVSGEWAGSFKNGVLSGTWSTLDGAVNTPFALQITKP